MLQSTAIRGSQDHTIGVLSGGCRRLVEIEEALRVLFAIFLISHFRTSRSRRSESLDRSALLVVLLEGDIAHQGALWGLDLIEQLTSRRDINWQNFRTITSDKRVVIVLQL